MKENAPEKIYLKPLLMEDGESVVRQCTFERNSDCEVEYIRADAFIDKTCEWIKTMWSETDDRFKEDYTGMLIDNFKNYIKIE